MFKKLFLKKKVYNLKKVIINNYISNTNKNNSLIEKRVFKSNFITKINHKNLLILAPHLTPKNELGISSINYRDLNKNPNNLFFSKKEKIIKYFIYNKFRSLLIFKYFMLMWCLYNYKFNNNSLIGIRNIISKIYNKKPYFKLINLRYFYLDSNIIASLITKKLKDRRKKVLIILNRALAKVKKFKHLTIWNGKLDLNYLLSQYEDENKLLNKNLYNEVMSVALQDDTASKNMVYYKDFLLRSKKDIISVIWL